MGFRNRLCIAVVQQRHCLNIWSNKNAETVCGNWKQKLLDIVYTTWFGKKHGKQYDT